nr:restriction endonuclease subunit S [Desulfurococcales archaeon]
LANYEKFRSTTVGTGIPHVNKKVFEEFLIPVPPIHEQKSIGEILSTVDRTIEVVNAGVARLEGLKKALMRELLTGRIRVREENGKTVFYREIEFQETEIGKIPKEWRIVKLNRIAQIIMGQSPPSETYNKDGIGMPFLQGKMEFGRIYPSPVMYTSDPIKIAEANDVLISVRAPVGDVNIAPYKICIGRGLAAIRFDPNQANYMFFFYYFQSIKERLETLGKGSTFKAITKKDLEELTVLNPSLKEQKLIGEILSTVDRTIELYYEERTRLDRLKRGLMDLLLTGRVRVVEE